MKMTQLVILLSIFSILACSNKDTMEDIPSSKTNTNETQSDDYQIEVFVEDLEVPWSIVFTSLDRVLVTERPGRLRVIENGVLNPKPLKVFNDVESSGEEGLMGLTLDPDYENNRFIYLSYAYDNEDGMAVKVVRYKDDGTSLSDEKVIIDNLPAQTYHAGCRIKFGPDSKLYVTTGDAGKRQIVPELDNLYGKILRLNADGSVPDDNPFPGSPVWSYGHRNPQGIAWYPGTDILYSTEHGPSGFDGPGGGDEVNIIVKGGHYGWPIVSHDENEEGLIAPVLVFTPAVAPSSAMFYSGEKLKEFQNNFFFGCLRGRGIMRVILDENDPTKVLSFEKLPEVDFGRIRDVVQGPDEAIYFGTSNQDGRGNPTPGDDKIYRIVKK